MCCITEEKAVFFFCFLFLGQDPRWSAIKVNGWKLLTIITKRPILDVAAALDQLLFTVKKRQCGENTRILILETMIGDLEFTLINLYNV